MILTEKSISCANSGSCDGVVIFSSVIAKLVVVAIFSVSFNLLTDEERLAV